MKTTSYIFIWLACFCAAPFAGATTRTVTTLADSGAGSLRAAITASLSGDIINFAPGLTNTILLTSGQLLIGSNLTITGPGANLLAISGNDSSRVFNILPLATVKISGLTIRNGRNAGANGPAGVIGHYSGYDGGVASGGAIFNQGTLTLVDCYVTANAAIGGNGGAGYQPDFPADSIGGVGGRGDGGAIYNLERLNALRCTFASNSVVGGTGGSGGASGAGIMDGGRGGTGQGGAIYNAGAAFLGLTNCTVSGNSVRGGNGGPAGFNTGGQTSWGGEGGVATGGGIKAVTNVFALVNCTISENTAFSSDGGSPGGYPSAYLQ